ncbi:MAG: o-succinylbenzoate synthase [bacterium]|nr:o-succinylbenzoate synthase [bacterium]
MNDVLIQRIELLQVAMSPPRPHVAAHGTVGERTVVLARIWDTDGAHGWGECVAFPEPGYLAETVDSAWDALKSGIAPAVLNRPFDSLDHLSDYLTGSVRHAPVARATIEMAAWDLVARRQGRCLAELLGGTRQNIATGRTIGLVKAPETITDRVDEARRDGFQRIKVKIEPRKALSIAIEAVKAAQGIPVVADANASFSSGDVQKLRELDAAGLTWIEQPFTPTSLRAVADLSDSLQTPIALDESVSSINAVERIIAMQAARGLSIKPGRLGGHSATRQVYRLALAAGLSLWIGGMLETGIGRAHNLALASLAGFDVVGDMGPSSAYWTRDLLTEPLEMVAGHIAVPTGHGIGVEVDTEYLRMATLRRQVFG